MTGVPVGCEEGGLCTWTLGLKQEVHLVVCVWLKKSYKHNTSSSEMTSTQTPVYINAEC